ncbi:hypothetical protein [Streptomyces sp. Isolate_45]|uniref:hypothetical protein n=1 Tax=Streptomyces sp. Isolate_45 TaxID=2950111 RepID=UPI002481E5C5|nr:hypothetical protein [Streptomyces sp. Isolate_45]MDA5282738.1 hypothetical protein [Streptomyces sp. Isolate_45]
MSGYRLHDSAALPAGLVAPFLVALALVPFRTELSATNEALIMVVVVVAVAALGTRVGLPGRPLPPEGARLVSVAPATRAGAALDTAGLSHQG